MDEVIEEHAIEKADQEVTILMASESKQGRLVESNVGSWTDSDQGEAGTIALQELGHQPKHDSSQLLVQYLQGCPSCS